MEEKETKKKQSIKYVLRALEVLVVSAAVVIVTVWGIQALSPKKKSQTVASTPQTPTTSKDDEGEVVEPPVEKIPLTKMTPEVFQKTAKEFNLKVEVIDQEERDNHTGNLLAKFKKYKAASDPEYRENVVTYSYTYRTDKYAQVKTFFARLIKEYKKDYNVTRIRTENKDNYDFLYVESAFDSGNRRVERITRMGDTSLLWITAKPNEQTAKEMEDFERALRKNAKDIK
ncbi:hypothetical protein B7939_01955 [Eggerthia catenaformis]|nr:hypothetical protein B7939_01955 [Eggerthia catenaformis]